MKADHIRLLRISSRFNRITFALRYTMLQKWLWDQRSAWLGFEECLATVVCAQWVGLVLMSSVLILCFISWRRRVAESFRPSWPAAMLSGFEPIFAPVPTAVVVTAIQHAGRGTKRFPKWPIFNRLSESRLVNRQIFLPVVARILFPIRNQLFRANFVIFNLLPGDSPSFW